MATAVQTLRKAVQRLVKPATSARRLPSNITMDLSPGQFLPLGHNAPPPRAPKGFSPPKFTEAEQAANPGLPMTRVVKDVLSVGKRKAGFDEKGKPFYWDVTEADLQEIAGCFSKAQSNGVAFNLTNSHGDMSTCIVPTESIISALDEVVVENGVLWCSSYVTPAVSLALQNPAMKVSPGIKPHFRDGEGHVYTLQLYHVAVVDQPVVPRQGPFMALANSQGVKAMDETILDLFKQIFEYEEMPLPDTVTVDNALEILPILVSQLVGSSGEESTEEGEETAVPAGESEEEDSVEMGNAQAPKWAQALIASNNALANRLNAIETESRKEVFSAKLNGLVSAGRLTQAQGIQMSNAAAANGFDTAVLDILAGGQAPVDGPKLGRKARVLANPQASGAPAIDKNKSAEAISDITGGKKRVRKAM